MSKLTKNLKNLPQSVLEDRKIYTMVERYVKTLTKVHRSKYGMLDWDDLTQECAIRVFEGKDSFNSESKFSTWAYRVCKNHLMNLNIFYNRMKREGDNHTLPMHSAKGLGGGDMLDEINAMQRVNKYYNRLGNTGQRLLERHFEGDGEKPSEVYHYQVVAGWESLGKELAAN